MEGYGTDVGVCPRAIKELFTQANKVKASTEYSFSLSMLEVYNETVMDLLGSKDQLDVRQSTDSKEVVVVGLTIMQVRFMVQFRKKCVYMICNT
jgi:kinesin family protein C2/C3